MNKTQPFRQHHITRALKAASAAGMHNPTLTVQLLPTGATITIGSADKPGASVSTTPAAKPNKPTRSRTPR
jgi:hypothetical protein